MDPHHSQPGIVSEYMIARLKNPLLGWEAGSAGDIPLRIFLIVGPRRVGRIRWSPSYVGLSQMCHESFAVAGDIFVDRLELRIVGHDVLAATVLNFHSDIFPDLDCYRSVVEIAVDLLDGIGGERSTIKPIRIESRTEGNVATARPDECQCLINLRLQPLAIRNSVVHHKDIQQFQVQLFDHLLKRGIFLEDMNVNINGMDRCERTQSTFFAGRRWSRRGSWRLSRGRQSDRET